LTSAAADSFQDQPLVWCLVWLMAPELGIGPFIATCEARLW
jgi:hypothetical protein